MDAHYIWFAFLWKCTKKCIPYLSGKFSKLSSNKKKGHYGFKAYPYPNILIHLVNWTTYMLPYRSKKAFIFLKFNTKKKGGQIATLNFSKWGGKLSLVPSSMNGISEVRTADSYGASEFMSVRILSGVCVAQSSVFCEFVIFCDSH